MQIVFLGLGNMGLNMALRLREKGHNIVGWSRSEETRIRARTARVKVTETVSDAIAATREENVPLLVWIMVTAGASVDEVIDAAGLELRQGDVIIDSANSYYKDTQRRHEQLSSRGINLIDVGISGGVSGALSGGSLTVGGNKEVYARYEALWKDLATEGGYVYCGQSGAGHFAKMVHNAIEYGMMQSIAEGMQLLAQSPFETNISEIVKTRGYSLLGEVLRRDQ